MKTILLISMLVLTSASNLFSQQGWFLTNAPNVNYQSVCFVNAQTGWATSARDIHKTTDGGASWTTLQYDTVNNINSKIYFLNENTGWILSYNGNGAPACAYIGSTFLTTNGGSSWIRKSYEYCSRPMDIYFINSNTGFIAYSNEMPFGGFNSFGAISKTTNGGLHWTNIHSGYEFHQINFKDSVTGYVLGHYWDDTSHDTLMLFKTTNTGTNWYKYKSITQITGGRFNLYESPVGLSVQENNIYIMGKDSVFLRSTDEGTNWQKIYYTPYKSHTDMNFINSNTGWILFKYGTDTTNMMKTTNGGANWFNLKNLYSYALNAIMFVNENTGYIAGNGIILKSITGGVTDIQVVSSIVPDAFELRQNYPNPFNGVSVIKFLIPKNANENIKLSIYNIQGKLIETLINDAISAGEYEVKWDSKNNSSGVYFYKLESGNFSEVKRMVLIK